MNAGAELIPTTAESEIHEQQRAEQLRLLCAQLPLGMGLSLTLAAVYVAVMWVSARHWRLLIWLMTLAAVNALRWTLFAHHRRLQTGPWDAVCALQFTLRIGAFLGGLAWGLTPWLFYPQGNLALELLNFLVLAGVTAGAATTLASDWWSASAFQLAAVVPFAAFLAVRGFRLHWLMDMMVLMYGVLATVSARRMSKQIGENIELRLKATHRERQLHESESRLRQIAHYDALTGLLNRYALIESLTSVLAQAERSKTKVALIYLDLDYFKNVNDTHGHAVGDQLLVAVADRLRRSLRSDDCVVRMGGDEFVVISTHARDRNAVTLLVTRLKAAINETFQLGSVALQMNVSIGVSSYPDDATAAEVLMQYADIAQYQAKAGGRNDYRFFDVNMKQMIQERMFLERALTEAIRSEQLFVEYQPLVDLPSGRLIGLEALLRWHHVERGLIAPAQFIPLAEQGGLINAIGERALREVCKQLRKWQQDLVPLVPVAVNVSSRQFEQGRVADLFIKVIEEFSVDPALIQIEITETELMRTLDVHAETLRRLREFGVRISIDDFGTGYSSLSYLKHLPIDCLKIDRSFIGDMINDTRDAAIVLAVIGIARSLGIVVVAEGVESASQAERLRSLGCAAAQGYYFYRPMRADQCQPLLEELAKRVAPSESLRLRLLHWVGVGVVKSV